MNILLFRRPLAYFIDFVIVWCACLLPQILAYQLFDGFPFRHFSKPHHLYFWVLQMIRDPEAKVFIKKMKRQANAV